jgi:hypothetical protein
MLYLIVGSIKNRRGPNSLLVGVINKKNIIPRYKVSSLAKDKVRLKVNKNFESLHPSSTIEATTNIDEINSRLITLY